MSHVLFERAAGRRHSAESAGSIAGPAGHVHPGQLYRLGLPDPAGQPIATLRALREDIAGRVKGLIEQLDG